MSLAKVVAYDADAWEKHLGAVCQRLIEEEADKN